MMIRAATVVLLAFLLNAPEAVGAEPFEMVSDERRERLLQPYPNEHWSDFAWNKPETIKIEDGLYSFSDRGTRTFFLVTDEGVITADPIHPISAQRLHDAIRKVTDQPVKYVIYSHNHWDHVRGAQVFKDEGAQIIAHEVCRDRIVERPHPDVVPPDIVFGGNYHLELGGERVDLLYYGKNHSSCMVFPMLRGGRYLFLVDLVSPGAIPWGPAPDADFIGTVQTLEQLEMLDFEAIIPGHGVPLAPKSALVERRLYLTDLMSVVQAELEAGYSEDFYDNIDRNMAHWSYMRGFDMHFKENVTTMLYYLGIGE